METRAAEDFGDGLEDDLGVPANDRTRLRAKQPHEVAREGRATLFIPPHWRVHRVPTTPSAGLKHPLLKQPSQGVPQGPARYPQLVAQLTLRRQASRPAVSPQAFAQILRSLFDERQSDGLGWGRGVGLFHLGRIFEGKLFSRGNSWPLDPFLSSLICHPASELSKQKTPTKRPL